MTQCHFVNENYVKFKLIFIVFKQLNIILKGVIKC